MMARSETVEKILDCNFNRRGVWGVVGRGEFGHKVATKCVSWSKHQLLSPPYNYS